MVGCFDRQIGGFRTLEDLVDKDGEPPDESPKVALHNESSTPVSTQRRYLCTRRQQVMAQGERGDVVAHLAGSQFVEHEDRHLHRRAVISSKAARQVFDGADGNRQQRDAQ